MSNRRRLISALCLSLLLLAGGSIGGGLQVLASETDSANAFLESVGADPSAAVHQEGLLNYAGPNCPGTGWNCTDTDQPVVQTALAGGANIFECPFGQSNCVGVQRAEESGESLAAASVFGGVANAAPGGGVNNVAQCIQNDSGQQAGPDVEQTCAGAAFNQSNTGTGKNTIVVTQIINQQDSGPAVNQRAEQNATLSQVSESGANSIQVLQKIHQSGKSDSPGAVSQTQLAIQFLTANQVSKTGNNSASVAQSQAQDLQVSGGGGAINQSQNVTGGEEDRRNVHARINQDSCMEEDADCAGLTGGKQDIRLRQDTDSFANASGTGSITQTQGSFEGGIEADLHQESSGISTLLADQDEAQKLDANTTGALSQTQIGPIDCCLINLNSQLGNPNNTATIDQTSIQNAGPDAAQFSLVHASFSSSGTTTINQKVCQNGECNTTEVGPTSGAVESDLVCANGSCGSNFEPSNDIPLVEDCPPGEGCDDLSEGECPEGQACGDMIGPVDGRVAYNQPESTAVALNLLVQVLTAQPSTTYQMFLVCGPTHATGCGFTNVGTITTNELGYGQVIVSVPPEKIPNANAEDCGELRTDHLDLLKGVGDTSAGMWAATPITYVIPCPPSDID